MAAAVRDFFDVVRQIALRDCGALTDGELLSAYVQRGDEPALSALVHRHGAMIWGVCQRLLGIGQDAEDAFQATFLVFIKKAASIRDPERVSNWLYGVAQQTSVRMRALRAKRGNRERQVEVLSDLAESSSSSAAAAWNDIKLLLDEELSRLPEKYRTLIVLCDLQEKPRSAVARQLGCPEGTVAGRLARARDMLAKRLVRRGLAVNGGILAAAFAAQGVSAAPSALVTATIQSATTGVMSASVAALTQGVLNAMFLNTLKFGAILVIMVLAIALGGFVAYVAAMQRPGDQDPIVARNPPPDVGKPGENKKVEAKFTMTASAPVLRQPNPVDLPDFKYWEVKVQFKNDGDQEIVLYPYLKLSVFDAAGKPVPRDAYIGWGLRPEEWVQEAEKAFLVLPPGKSKEIEVNLGQYATLMYGIGWDFKKPGTYKIDLAYDYQRKTFHKDISTWLIGRDELAKWTARPERLWNRAVEMKKSVSVELKIVK